MKNIIVILLQVLLPYFLFGQSNWLDFRTTNLNGCKSFVSLGDLDVSGNKLTVEATIFVKPNSTLCPSTPYHDVVSKHYDNTNVNYLLRPDHAEISTNNGFYVTKPTTICENHTYHIAMVYDGNYLKFFKDNMFVDSIAVSGNMVLSNYIATLGYSGGDNPNYFTQFWGQMDNVRIWKMARTKIQLQEFAFKDIPNPDTQVNLIASYNFDDNYNNSVSNQFNGSPSNGNISRTIAAVTSSQMGTLELAQGGCIGKEVNVNFVENNIIQNQQYTWSVNNVRLSETSKVLKFVPVVVGSTSVCLEVKNSCSSYTICKNLVIKDQVRIDISRSICANECTELFGEIYCTQGIYEILRPNPDGCDSIISLSIYLSGDVITNKINHMLCIGDSISVNNSIYKSSGSYFQNFKTIKGCDSILVIDVKVTDFIEVKESYLICENDSVIAHNKIFRSPGLFTFSVPSATSCDTMVEIKISTIPTNYSFDTFNLCGQASLQIDDATYLDSGDYTQRLQNQSGCDSILSYHIFNRTYSLDSNFESNNVKLGDSIALVLSIEPKSGDMTIDWQPKTFLNCDSCLSNMIVPLDNISYSISAHDGFGCFSYKDINIIVDKVRSFDISNIINLNSTTGNNKIRYFTRNDVFGIDYLKIYDRWGNLIFHDLNLPKGLAYLSWDNMFKGQLVQSGIYTWVVKVKYIDDKIILHKGSINVIE